MRRVAEKILTTSDREHAQRLAEAMHNVDEAFPDTGATPALVLADYLKRYEAAYLDSLQKIERLTRENVRLRQIEQQVLDERRQQAELDAWHRESDVRCFVCGTRYAERQDYGCQDQVGLAHRYDEEELAEARELRDED